MIMYKKLLSRWMQKDNNQYWYPHECLTPAWSNTVVYYTGKIRIVATTLSQWSVN